MKKRGRLRKGLAMLLTATMVVGLMPGAGTIKVSAEEGEASVSEATATEQHADVATFTVDEANHSITATCPSYGNLGTITLSASDATYDGTAKVASTSGAIKGFDTPLIVYEKKGADDNFATINSTPTDAGTYRASITYTVGEEPENKYSVSVEYIIAKADTREKANCEMELQYDDASGSYTATIAQVDGAEYKFGESDEWSSENMFKGIAHGTQVTGYIRIAGDDNHNPGVDSSEILTSGHGTMKHYEAKEADCVNEGNEEYWYCESCGKYFSDENGTTETTKEDVTKKAKGHTDNDEDGICEVCNAYIDGVGARLAGHSLTLDGSVGVNFYMELSSEVISDNSAYMEFTLPGGKTSTVKVSEAPTEVISGTTYYKFKCQVNATAMTDTITAQIKSTVGNSKVYEYTVKEYADYFFEHKNENTEFAKAAELIEAMVNYGSYAQIYAGYNTENLAVGDAKKLKSLDDVRINRYYEPSPYETKVQFAGANLSLLSTTTLRMYFKITDIDAESVLIGYQGQALEKTQSGDYYYVELVGIPASKLDDEFCIDVGDGSTNFIVTYTPMAYCTSVVHRETTETRTEDLKNLIKALVLYNRAADAYISEN